MALHQLFAAVVKETRIVLRDKEALLILLVMPAVFVLIMSLALRDSFHEKAGVRFPVLVVDEDGGRVGTAVRAAFAGSPYFEVQSATGGFDAAALRAAVVDGGYKFAIRVPAAASHEAVSRVRQAASAPIEVTLLADPTLRRDHRSLVIALLNSALREIESGIVLEQLAAGRPLPVSAAGKPALFAPVADIYDEGHGDLPIPTSVQQNAPAWTLLAMFFVVIPLSVTLIREAQQGSLTRLRTMPVSSWTLLTGKVAPYFAINQVQVILVLLEGKYLLPLLGGDALDMGDSPGGIALVSLAANLAAIGFGLLVAAFARTQEQATTFGAVSVLILAAIGGIMVPKLVMPPLMQDLAGLSPLSWGLEGFFDVFIRGGGINDVLPEAARLAAFAAACFAIAVVRLHRVRLRA